MDQVPYAVDHGSGGKQESRAPNQPGRQVMVSEGVGIPEVMAFVNKYKAASSRGKPASADLFMGTQGDRNREAIGSRLPLGY
jgi:hypothetical protein